VATVPFLGWMANAAACLTGSHGAVAQQARQTGCSRQCASDHSEKVLAAVEARPGGGPTPEELMCPLARSDRVMHEAVADDQEVPLRYYVPFGFFFAL
jgi:hypothetical protein